MRKERFQSIHLEGESTFYSDIGSVDLKTEYDLTIVCSSWDERCLFFSKLNNLTTKKVILICFDNRDEHGEREKNDSTLKHWANQLTGNNVEIVNGNSTDVIEAFTSVMEFIVKAYLSKGAPLKLLFDLSTCPRFISLSTLCKSFDLGIVKSFDFVYGECEYPALSEGLFKSDESFSQDKEETVFTGGVWTPKSIEGISSGYSVTGTSEYIVSVGFEGNKTLQILNKYDPNSVAVLIPNPGFKEQYNDRVIADNSELIDIYRVRDKGQISSPAGDAIDAWKKLNEYRKGGVHDNYVYICAGTKSHSLALVLSALTNKNTEVLYNLPEKHEYVPIKAIERYWVYSVVNNAVPANI